MRFRRGTPLASKLLAARLPIYELDGNAYLNRPGPRIVEAVETIAAWLRGENVSAGRAVELRGAARS